LGLQASKMLRSFKAQADVSAYDKDRQPAKIDVVQETDGSLLLDMKTKHGEATHVRDMRWMG
jgi:hypothetical protein